MSNRVWLWCVVLVLVALAGSSAFVRPTSGSFDADALAAQAYHGRSIQDYAPTRPVGRTAFDDITPRVFVKFDDGRAGLDPNNPVKAQVAAFLRRGLPVALALNANTIGTAGTMTWDDVRDLQDFAVKHGTVLHLQSHFNGNLATPFELSHQGLVDELEVSLIYRETGYRVRSAVLPGDPGRQEFMRRNRDYLAAVADSLGLWWIQHIVANDTTEVVNFVPSSETIDVAWDAESNYRLGGSFLEFVRPGMGIGRMSIPTAGINDVQGTVAVERVASWPSQYDSVNTTTPGGDYLYGLESVTGVIPPYHDGWTLAGNGANPAGSVAYQQTLWHYIGARLANNFGFTITMHDSAGAGNSGISGVSNTEIENAWSPDHVAWVLAMLARTELPDGTPIQPHIKVVGPEEFYEYATGVLADGVDLIDNPSLEIPQYAIGDTLGGTSEYPWPRGFTAIGVQAAAQPNTTSWLRSLSLEQTGNVAKYNRASSNAPYAVVGPGVTGVRGRSGGLSLGTTVNTMKLSYGNLPPGRYRLSMAVDAATAGALTIQEYHLAAKVKGHKYNASIEAGMVPVYADTVLMYQWRDAGVGPTLPSEAVGTWWGDMVLEFNAPDGWTGDAGSGAALFGQSAEATGDTWPQPYANGVAEFAPLVNQTRWALALSFYATADVTISYPRLIYLGD